MFYGQSCGRRISELGQSVVRYSAMNQNYLSITKNNSFANETRPP